MTEPDTRVVYLGLVALVALQRLLEVVVSARNRRRMLALGGREWGRGHYPVMVVLHTAFLAACAAEVWLLGRPFLPLLAALMAVVLASATLLRYWTLATLGERWCTRVVTLPGEIPVTRGPYRWMRHPNYVAVAAEMLALPLLHGAWMTAACFSLANGLLLAHRIRVEERAMAPDAGGAEP